jgi:DNA ligase 1
MRDFANLLDKLTLTASRNAKLQLLKDYFRSAPDPDRGYALAAIAGDLSLRTVKPALMRRLISEQIDPVLFNLSYDFVGDLAETISLLWTSADAPPGGLSLGEAVAQLQQASGTQAPRVLKEMLDGLDPSSRYALIKLATGALRIGVSSRLVKQALASFGDKQVNEIEELWHGQTPPYLEMFAWLEGRAEMPPQVSKSPFRPVMLATPLEPRDMETVNPEDYAAEWKWDGIRVQAVCEDGVRRLYSRTGDDISGAFPDLVEHLDFEGSLDGELLTGLPDPDGGMIIGTFGDLQQRLNRKSVPAKVLKDFPAVMQAYDILTDGKEDLRQLPFAERRTRLETFAAGLDKSRFALSPLLRFQSWEELAALRASPPHAIIEGVMLKRKDSAYVPGRPKGPWFKWKQDPKVIDAVLMYAQRGHGKRSSFYSDYTFGVWNSAGELVPVGKAYFGFTDEELKQIDKYVRDNTVERFGPVRSVRAELQRGLVLEVAFEGLNRSSRHKSGVAMRFPRISRLRWDKKPADADQLETLERML